MANFVKTQDKATRDALIKEGFKLIKEERGVATFLNDPGKTLRFSGQKVLYTNKLEM